jgi:hypothetical protein
VVLWTIALRVERILTSIALSASTAYTTSRAVSKTARDIEQSFDMMNELKLLK